MCYSDSLTIENIETLRELASAYWQTFNAYQHAERLLFLEENYRNKKANSILSDIGQIQRYDIKLSVEEESPSEMTGVHEAEMLLLMTEPLGTRVIRMVFRQIVTEWKITYTETAD